jgi:hypothetical protein
VEIFGFNQLSVNDTRLDLHVGSVECIWLEIKINNKKYLYGTFYIPPNSGQQIWSFCSIISKLIYVKITCDNDIMVTIQCEINRLLKFFPNLLTTVRRNIKRSI